MSLPALISPRAGLLAALVLAAALPVLAGIVLFATLPIPDFAFGG